MLPYINELINQVWKVIISSKLKCFLWKVLSDAFPTGLSLERRGMKVDNRCQACGEEGESINHIIFSSTVARQAWALSTIPHPQRGFHLHSIFENLIFLLSLTRTSIGIEARRVWPWVLWQLWKK